MKDAIDPDLEPWQKSLETDILLGCPALGCGYLFGNTLTITARSTSGQITCRRCGADMDWEKEVKVTYKTKLKMT